MQIIEQHWNEEKLDFNETVFVRSKVDMDNQAGETSTSFLESLDTFKIPIIGSGGAAALMVIIGVIIIAAIKCQKGDAPAATPPPVIVQTTATTSPVVSATATASPVVTATAPSMCPPPAYEACQPTLDPEKIEKIGMMDRTPQQIAVMLRHSMRKPPISTSN
jgi:hypothetical protein